MTFVWVSGNGLDMAANDAWELQGMNGGVILNSGQTFTGLSRGIFGFSGGSVAVTMTNPAGAGASNTLTITADGYVPGPFTSVAPTSAKAIVYPISTDYTVV